MTNEDTSIDVNFKKLTEEEIEKLTPKERKKYNEQMSEKERREQAGELNKI